MTVGNLTELSSWVLGWGKTAKVVEPESLATSSDSSCPRRSRSTTTPSEGG